MSMTVPSSISVPEYIRTLVPYVPGKPIEETQREFKIRKVIKLASNENPLGPSPKAVQALRSGIKELHRYPDSGAFRLRRELSKATGLTEGSFMIGNGSNEVIDAICRTFCQPGDAMVTSKGAFVAYKICAQVHGVQTLESEMGSDLKFNLDAILGLIQKNSKVKVVFIANPNNPTGTYVPDSDLRNFMTEVAKVRGGSVLVVLDYAYWEYVTASDLSNPLDLLQDFENLIVLRTFSKVYGLAGLRVGYGMGKPELMNNLDRIRNPFNVNSLALVAAEAALTDKGFVSQAKRTNQTGMKLWQTALAKKKIPFWESQGNFLLADVKRPTGKTGPEIYQKCLRKGVIFRPVANYGMDYGLRISVGTPEENKVALRVLLSEMGLGTV